MITVIEHDKTHVITAWKYTLYNTINYLANNSLLT